MMQRLMLLVVLALPCALAGCGGGNAGAVTGAATLDGKPLPDVAIDFISPDGQFVSVFTDGQGQYTVPVVSAGLNKVQVRGRPVEEAPEDAKKRPQGGDTKPAATVVPEKYATASTSQLEVDVVAGKTTTYAIVLTK